jgi:hypothetical protein
MTTIADRSVTLSGVTLTLRADLSALAKIEDKFGASFVSVLSKIGSDLRISDVAKLLECLCVSVEPDTKKSTLELMADLGGYRDAVECIQDAVTAAMPQATGEAGNEAAADPL